jgi:hypothetical protein
VTPAALALCAVLLGGCPGAEKPREEASVAVPVKPHLVEMRRQLVQEMLDYQAEADPDYGPQDVERCAAVLDRFLAAAAAASGPERDARLLAAVEAAVKSLNELSAECEELIETDQREGICALIDAALEEAGYDTKGRDVTEQWREW